jgi:hypothetical protein
MKVLLALALVGCGGSDGIDLGGMYQVTADVASAPCGADQPVMMPPAYIKFESSDLFGAKLFSYASCTDAAGTMCDGVGGLFGSFSEPIDNGWRGIESYYSTSGTLCTLGYSERTAILTGSMLVIEDTRYRDSPMLDEAHCTTDEAEKRGTTMPCEMHEHVEATRL